MLMVTWSGLKVMMLHKKHKILFLVLCFTNVIHNKIMVATSKLSL